MGPIHTRVRAARPRRLRHPAAVTAQRLDRLRTQIERSIIATAEGVENQLLNETVVAAVTAFSDSRHDLSRAAATIAHLLDRVGEQHARRGFDADQLASFFRAARVATQKGLAPVVGDLITSDDLLRLREDLATYLLELHSHAHASFVNTQRLQTMSPQQRRARLNAMTFGLDETDDIEKLAAWEGIDPQERVVAIVSVSIALPSMLREHPRAIAGSSDCEALVPEAWSRDGLATELAGQAVVCPPVPLTQAAEAVTLARQGAKLLREGIIADSRIIVPGADLLGNLVVDSNRLLAELIINKHLSALEAMSISRRVSLGELALGSLESGQPIDQVAKQLGIPRQTAHSRMKAIRSILGEAMLDPVQRLELIVALRAALPRWRHQLTGRSSA